MLKVQEYLSNNSLERLEEEFRIKHHRHPHHPNLVGLIYTDSSPKTHPIVTECRGLVLDDRYWDVVARPFDRFFDLNSNDNIDWNKASCVEKLDGSLIILYYYKGQWYAKTSGAFGFQEISSNFTISWQSYFFNILPKYFTFLSELTYCFELCSPYNTVVQRHYTSSAKLIGARTTDGKWDLSDRTLDEIAKDSLRRPERFHFSSSEEMQQKLLSVSQEYAAFEGFVIRCGDTRYKVKSPKYNALHHLKDPNIPLLKRYFPLAHECSDDLLGYVDVDTLTEIGKMRKVLKSAKKDVMRTYSEHYNKTQKDFAIAVKDHPLAAILFQMKKQHGIFSPDVVLDELWIKYADLIEKNYHKLGGTIEEK